MQLAAIEVSATACWVSHWEELDYRVFICQFEVVGRGKRLVEDGGTLIYGAEESTRCYFIDIAPP